MIVFVKDNIRIKEEDGYLILFVNDEEVEKISINGVITLEQYQQRIDFLLTSYIVYKG